MLTMNQMGFLKHKNMLLFDKGYFSYEN